MDLQGSYGEIAAICTVLCWAIGMFPFTEASRRLGPESVNNFRLLLATLINSVIIYIAYTLSMDQLFARPGIESWIWLGGSGIIGLAIGDFFGFTSFAILGPRLASIFTTLAPAASLITGYFLLDETLNLIGVMGMIITLSGVVWLSINKKEKSKVLDRGFGGIKKGVVFALLSALCQGGGLVMAKKGMLTAQEQLIPIQASWMRIISATVILYILSIAMGRFKSLHETIMANKGNGLFHLVSGTIFGPVLGVGLSMMAVSMINASVAQTIFSLVPVVVLPLGFILYREKITWVSVMASIIAVGGVCVLIWRDQILALIN